MYVFLASRRPLANLDPIFKDCVAFEDFEKKYGLKILVGFDAELRGGCIQRELNAPLSSAPILRPSKISQDQAQRASCEPKGSLSPW